ncbi:MAG: hypothetical protein OEM46_01575 [Ignavibacteria bacterium]|nr:hypothetical protein [Ignavibacteria bacterium]
MKSFLKSAFLLLSIIFIFYSCQNQEGEGEEEMNEQKIYKTPEEAAVNAKSDLIQVLETKKEIDLGIDVAELRKAELIRPAKYQEVDFEKLLTTETIQRLSDISFSPKSMIAPYVLENNVVGVAEVKEVNDGWKVAGLGNKPITDDLNTTRATLNSNSEVTIYEVPNLQLFIYGVKKEASETYYLNFGEFTLKDSTALKTFYPAIRESAMRFQKKFGEQLKKEKLVK